MPDTPTLIVFLIAALALLVTPGPAVLYIVARSLDQGRLAGVVSTLGIGLGTLVHVLAAALGVSALLVSSALAFGLVKYLGAAYLIYLGLRKVMSRENAPLRDRPEPQHLSRLFYQGILVNVLNPKTALFFFAFLPQFIDLGRGAVAGQILLLGVMFVVLGIFSDGLWAMLAGTVGHWLRGHAAPSKGRFLRGQRYLSGGIFIALGVTTALSGTGNK